jgi:hypothetical protein
MQEEEEVCVLDLQLAALILLLELDGRRLVLASVGLYDAAQHQSGTKLLWLPVH